MQDAKKSIDECRKYLLKGSNNVNPSLLYRSIGNFFVASGNVDSALIYYEESLLHVNDLHLEELLHSKVGELFKSLGDFESAHRHLVKSKLLNDSISLIFKRAAEYELKYEKLLVENNLSNQKLENARVNETLKRRNMTIIISIASGLILALIILSFYLREKNRRQLNEHEKLAANKRIDELLKTQELKSIQKVLEIQEEERTRIAQDLHDRLGGMIATTRLLFEDLQYSIAEIQTKSSNTYKKALKILEDAGDEVRHVAHNIANSTLKTGGLKTALNELADNIMSSESISFNFIYTGQSLRFNTKFESYLYRIVQELVSNTLKHSKASSIDLNLTIDSNELTMIYEDNGSGFKVDEVKYGIGLKGINKRLEELGGNLEIDSSAGNGSIFIIKLSDIKEYGYEGVVS
jgi:signal transduction histidine kinase